MRRADGEASLDTGQAQAADAGLKGMIPIGRPFLDYVLSGLADAGLSEVCLVIGPEHDVVRDHFRRLAPRRLAVSFATQAEPKGTADAVLAAESFAADAPFLVLNSDNYYPAAACRALAEIDTAGLAGFDATALVAGSNIPLERVRQFALVESDADGWLTSIVEKPDAATWQRLAGHALVSMNLWRFTPVIFEACRRVTVSPRGELELQDAIRIAMHQLGERIRVVRRAEGVLDLSSRRDVADVARRLAGVTVTL
jgi:glucose-1-phosphate thymidylyltransferase